MDAESVEAEDAPYSPSTSVNANIDCTRAKGFIRNYFSSSRLHHLSLWKNQLRKYTSFNPSLDAKCFHETRVIMFVAVRFLNESRHVDMDCFFAAVGLRDRPELVNAPVGICHGHGGGTSDVASCNYVARKFGIRNGMHLGRARKLCPEV